MARSTLLLENVKPMPQLCILFEQVGKFNGGRRRANDGNRTIRPLQPNRAEVHQKRQ
jgi:hypothetical protein